MSVKSLILLALLVSSASASDWPQLLGPTRDAVYAGPPLATAWPKEGPPILWSAKVGEGYSNPVTSEGRVVIAHRIGNNLVVDSLDAKTGTNQWRFEHPMVFQDGAGFDNGPRATPAITDGRVFVQNADGYFACLDLKTGKQLWSHEVKTEFGSSATWFGCVSSPLVTEKAVFLLVGSTNAGVVALAPATGEVQWKALGEKATASTPVLATLDGKPQLMVVTRSALHGLDPATGKEYWHYPMRRQTSGEVYAANPVVFGDQVFLSGWYKLGALLLRVKEDKAEKVWHLDDAVSTHYATSLILDGYAYGYHGHAWESGGPQLRCVEVATGKVMWEGEKNGSGTVIRFGDHLLILSDRGELMLAKASPKEFKVTSRFQAVGRTTRNYPALADGFAYIKGPRKLVCLDLRAAK